MTKSISDASGRHGRPDRKHSAEHPEHKNLKTKVSKTDGFTLGKQEINLRYTEQLIDTEQTAALSLLLKYAVEHLIDGKRTLSEVVTDSDSRDSPSCPETAKSPAATPCQGSRKFTPASTATDAPDIPRGENRPII